MEHVDPNEVFQEAVVAAGLHEYHTLLQAVRHWQTRLQQKKRQKQSSAAILLDLKRRQQRRWLGLMLRATFLCQRARTQEQLVVQRRKIGSWRQWRSVYAFQCKLHNIADVIDTWRVRRLLQVWQHATHETKAAQTMLNAARRFLLHVVFSRLRLQRQNLQLTKSLRVMQEYFHTKRVPLYFVRRWRANTKGKQIQRAALVAIAAKRRAATMRTSFQYLWQHALAAKRSRAHEFLAFAHYQAKFLRKIWNAFRIGVNAQRALKPLVESLRMKIREWHKNTQASKFNRQSDAAAAGFRRRSLLRRYFSIVRDFRKNQQRRHVLLFQAMTFHNMALQQTSLVAWYGLAARTKRLKKAEALVWNNVNAAIARKALGAMKRHFDKVKTREHALLHYHHSLQQTVFIRWKELTRANAPRRFDNWQREHLLKRWVASKCLRNWRQEVHRRQTLSQYFQQLSDKLQLHRRSAILSVWCKCALAANHDRETACIAEAHFRRATLSRYVKTWRANIRLCNRLLAAESELRSYVRSHALRRVMGTMISMTFQLRRLRAAIQSLDGVMARVSRHTCLRSGMARWKDRWAAWRVDAVRHAEADKFRRNQLLRPTFVALLAYMKLRRLKYSQKLVADKSLVQLRISRAWSAVVLHHLDCLRYASQMATAYEFRAGSLLRSCFAAWRAWLATRKQLLNSNIFGTAPAFRRAFFDVDRINIRDSDAAPLPTALYSGDPLEAALAKVVEAETCRVRLPGSDLERLREPADAQEEQASVASTAAVSCPIRSHKRRPRPLPLVDDGVNPEQQAAKNTHGVVIPPAALIGTHPPPIAPSYQNLVSVSLRELQATKLAWDPSVAATGVQSPNTEWHERLVEKMEFARHDVTCPPVPPEPGGLTDIAHKLIQTQYWTSLQKEAGQQEVRLEMLRGRLELLLPIAALYEEHNPHEPGPYQHVVCELRAQIQSIELTLERWRALWAAVAPKLDAYTQPIRHAVP